MLKLEVHGRDEEYNEETEEFSEVVPPFELHLEHSLVSLSKWESKHKKPFLHGEKTVEETLSYIEMMILNPEFPPGIFSQLTSGHIDIIQAYIEDPHTATTFRDAGDKKRAQEIITSELIYYWMFSSGIPKDCEVWHLNRLLTLIKVYGAKNQKPDRKKMSRGEMLAQRRRLNEQRLAEHKTTG